MAIVAVERDTDPRHDLDRADDRMAVEPRVSAEHERPWLERQALRYVTWSSEHPHSIIHRTQHKVAMVLCRLGLGRFDDDMLVTTIGRKSGLPRRVVVSALYIDDRLYVVNPFGERAQWYRNLVSDPIVTLQRRGKTWTARATRVTGHEEAVSIYERIPRGSGSMMRWLLRAEGIAETAEAFADNIDRVCFVRLDEVVAARSAAACTRPLMGLAGRWVVRAPGPTGPSAPDGRHRDDGPRRPGPGERRARMGSRLRTHRSPRYASGG